MKRIIFACIGLILGSIYFSNAQVTQLEIPRATLPAVLPVGPTTTAQTATLLRNSAPNTFVAYNPPVAVTVSFSDQQYVNVPNMNGTSPGPAMQFGAQPSFGTSSSPGPVNTWFATVGPPFTNNVPASFTSNPAGPAGTGIETGNNNYSAYLGISTRPLRISNAPLNGRYYYGKIVITFNRPVSNPVVHVSDLGAFNGFAGSRLGFAAELELDSLAGTSIVRLSGNSFFAVTPTFRRIANNSAPFIYNNTTGTLNAADGSVRVITTNPVTSLAFSVYIRGDQQGGTWETTVFPSNYIEGIGIGVSLNAVSINGTVYDDANGLVDNSISTGNTGTNTGGLNAVLVDPGTNLVINAVPVAANGTYAFNTALAGANTYVVITTNTATVGAAAPTVALPAGWVSTGELQGTGTGNDGNANATLTTLIPLNANLTNANFGIEQLPNSNPSSTTIAQPAGGSFIPLSGGSNPPALSGSDPEDGTLGVGQNIAITSLPTNGNQLWYSGVQITLGQDGVNPPSPANPFIITNYTSSALQLKASGTGSTSTSFNFAFIDAAGKQDPTPATYDLNWGTPLPVQLLSFSGGMNQCDAILHWSTGEEASFSHFEIQHSTDGDNFRNAGTIDAKGQGSSYSFLYKAPAEGRNYFRLNIIDQDNASEYSKVIEVNNNCQPGKITVYPNPTTGKFTLSGLWGKSKIRLTNNFGQIMKEVATVEREHTIDMHEFAAGTYFIQVERDGAPSGMVKLNYRP